MKNTFIIAMFIFWGFVVAVVSAGYVVKQNRLAQESMQRSYLESLQQITDTITQGKTRVTTPTPATTQKPVVTNTNTNVQTTPKPAITTAPVVTPTPKPAGLTLATVATHNTQADCWIVINGNVYSVASYIPMHPGGAKKIANLCGRDASSGYDGQGHSSFADSLLGSYLVGKLQ